MSAGESSQASRDVEYLTITYDPAAGYACECDMSGNLAVELERNTDRVSQLNGIIDSLKRDLQRGPERTAQLTSATGLGAAARGAEHMQAAPQQQQRWPGGAMVEEGQLPDDNRAASATGRGAAAPGREPILLHAFGEDMEVCEGLHAPELEPYIYLGQVLHPCRGSVQRLFAVSESQIRMLLMQPSGANARGRQRPEAHVAGVAATFIQGVSELLRTTSGSYRPNSLPVVKANRVVQQVVAMYEQAVRDGVPGEDPVAWARIQPSKWEDTCKTLHSGPSGLRLPGCFNTYLCMAALVIMPIEPEDERSLAQVLGFSLRDATLSSMKDFHVKETLQSYGMHTLANKWSAINQLLRLQLLARCTYVVEMDAALECLPDATGLRDTPGSRASWKMEYDFVPVQGGYMAWVQTGAEDEERGE
ncbi:hypothetical protein PLESTM_001650300 [Pleodorina starrii]|nr:hypothetical protein PLESTM_001650300 [Pleodorina starrii]